MIDILILAKKKSLSLISDVSNLINLRNLYFTECTTAYHTKEKIDNGIIRQVWM